ncbi:MAG: hypothetical protein AUJ92_19075 [Armatimonadetes bacterium CG2_30_59_28]|nr:MAG: hypothetical protein AUJ92_19075 [Armatimonadetes bacterium CG2_30_59_28]
MLLVVSALVLVKPGLCFSQSEGGGTRLTLDESIRIALENNPGVETAERGRRAAQERIPQAKAQFGPDIDIIASHTLQGPTISFPTGLGTSTTIVPDSRNDYILQLSQTLYAGDSIPASRRAARLGAGVAADTLEDVRQDVVLRSKVAYFSVLRAEALRVVVAEALELAREHLRVANAHFDAGTVPKFDVLRSEVEVAQAEEFLVQADNAISLAGASFNSALGRPVDSPVALEAVDASGLRTPSLEESLDLAMQQRPELRVAEKSVTIAKESVTIEKAGRRPAVTLGAQYHRQTATGFSEDYFWNVALSLMLPVFDRGLAKSRVRESREIVAQNRSMGEQVRQAVALEVQQTLLNTREAVKRIETTKKSVAAAEESLRIADLRYQEGIGTQLEATDARVALTRARVSYTQALYDYHAAYAVWENAVGNALVSDSVVRIER